MHTWARKLLLPPFSVTSVAKYEQETRELCATLIDGFIANGRADGAADYAQQIPPRVIASMLGIPKEMAGDVHRVGARLPRAGPHEPGAARASRRSNIFTYLNEQIQERKENPGRTT